MLWFCCENAFVPVVIRVRSVTGCYLPLLHISCQHMNVLWLIVKVLVNTLKKTCYSYQLQNYTFIQSCQFNTNELKTQGNYNIKCMIRATSFFCSYISILVELNSIMFLEYSTLGCFVMILDKCAWMISYAPLLNKF